MHKHRMGWSHDNGFKSCFDMLSFYLFIIILLFFDRQLKSFWRGQMTSR